MVDKNIGYIICEAVTATVEDLDITEKGRRVMGRGRLQTANEVNRNRRIYEYDELLREINAPRQKELLAAGYLRAESGHPMSKDLVRQQTIDPSNTCAIFKSLEMKGMDVMGTFIGTNNALGEAFDLDLRDGYKPAWSLRALGSVENTPKGACVKNLKMITYDHVIYPSHPNAYTIDLVSESAVLGESAVYDSNNLPKHTLKVTDNVITEGMNMNNNILTPITNTEVMDYIRRNSNNFKGIQESFDLLYDDIVLNESKNDVILTDKDGNTLVCHLENYIHNTIMNHYYR